MKQLIRELYGVTGRPNAMASVASDKAVLLMECIKKYAVQGRA